MNKTEKTLLKTAGVLAGTVAAGVGFSAFSRLRWGRSGSATISAAAMRLGGPRQDLLGRDLGRFDDYVARRRAENEEAYTIPKWVAMQSLVFEETCDGMKTFHVGTTGMNKHAILYLHGGTYVDQIAGHEWFFIDELCRRTGAEVYVPIYPLAPAHDYDEAYSVLTDLYESITARYSAKDVTILGVGAGGGLAAGMAETFLHYDLPQPGKLVLVSPMLDISMRNPDITDRFDLDPQYAPWGVAQVGDLWADGDDVTSARLSPIYGNVLPLRNVTTFVGTRELFYPDCAKWDALLAEAGVTHELIVGTGQNHAWPLSITPEGQDARDLIVEIIGTR